MFSFSEYLFYFSGSLIFNGKLYYIIMLSCFINLFYLGYVFHDDVFERTDSTFKVLVLFLFSRQTIWFIFIFRYFHCRLMSCRQEREGTALSL